MGSNFEQFIHRLVNATGMLTTGGKIGFVAANVGERGRSEAGDDRERESIEDGHLSVFVMRKKTRGGFVAASVRALFNRSRADDMVELQNVKRLTVASRRSALAVSLDGEVVGAAPPLVYKIRKKALRVIAPAPEK